MCAALLEAGAVLLAGGACARPLVGGAGSWPQALSRGMSGGGMS